METSDKLIQEATFSDKTELKILHLTDFHADQHGLEKFIMLKDKIKEENIIYDIVFISGDFQSYLIEEWRNPIIIAKAKQETIKILEYVESICPNIYFIPGNHDLPILFLNSNIETPGLVTESLDINDESIKLKENWINMHGNIVNIAKGLKLAGYGGCKDNLLEKDGEFIGVSPEAFPYKDEEDFSIGLQSMFSKLTHEYAFGENFQLILMTHIGPYSSLTTVNKYKRESFGEIIHSGSKTLENLITINSELMLFNIHGHTHKAVKQTEINGVPIINPNALFLGRYAEYKLKINGNNKWYLEQINFLEI